MINELLDTSTELDNIANAFSSGDIESLMELSGQSEKQAQSGLSRMNINYSEETEDGKLLSRGSWKMYKDGQYLYAESVEFRPLLRTYEWSVWDQETGTFSSKSVQKPTLKGSFPDSTGGDKCGRLSRDEEESLSSDDPRVLQSRAAVCNQVIYGTVSGTFKVGHQDGEEVTLDNSPVVSYFKKSGFRPIREFIESLTKQKKIMQHCVIKLNTDRKKNGGIVYWVPVPTLAGEAPITEDDKNLMKMFTETVKGHNENIMNQYRQVSKMLMDQEDIDLADDFKDDIAS